MYKAEKKEKQIYNNISLDNLKASLENKNNDITIIIKFGADWCKPCQNCKHLCYEYFEKLPENVVCLDLDVDNNAAIFSAFKSKKMVKTIPALLCFFGNSDRDHWYIPDKNLSSSDPNDIKYFFDQIM